MTGWRVHYKSMLMVISKNLDEINCIDCVTGSEKKLQVHAEASIKCRDPGIQALVWKYNKLVDHIVRVIKEDRK